MKYIKSGNFVHHFRPRVLAATTMSRRPMFNVVLFLALCMAGWAAGQTIYNAFNYYKPMTDDYDVQVKGSLFLPPCVKDLMNCWEILRQDLVCRYGMVFRIALESMCMDLRFQCKEYTGPMPFKSLNVTVWNFCPPNTEEQKKLSMNPISPWVWKTGLGVNMVNENLGNWGK